MFETHSSEIVLLNLSRLWKVWHNHPPSFSTQGNRLGIAGFDQLQNKVSLCYRKSSKIRYKKREGVVIHFL